MSPIRWKDCGPEACGGLRRHHAEGLDSAPQDRNVQGWDCRSLRHGNPEMLHQCEYSSTIWGTISGPRRASDATPCVAYRQKGPKTELYYGEFRGLVPSFFRIIHKFRTNKPYCVGASGIGRGERTLSWGRAQHRRRPSPMLLPPPGFRASSVPNLF